MCAAGVSSNQSCCYFLMGVFAGCILFRTSDVMPFETLDITFRARV